MYNKILIIDDNKEIQTALKIFLRNHFKEIITLSNPNQLNEKLDNHDFEVIILDMNFKAGNSNGNEGLFWLKEILKKDPGLSVICITAYGEIKLAVQALKKGAVDFIEKPWKEDHLLASIIRAAKQTRSQKTINELKNKNRNLASSQLQLPDYIHSKSLEMKKVWETIEKVAPTDANVLITGENGTGKEILAKIIHTKSKRRTEPFISVDLGALVPSLFESELFGHKKGAFTDAIKDKKGWFELAEGGTIFLDEIGNLELKQQAKLLSVLQNKQIVPVGGNQPVNTDIRIISATNADLDSMIHHKEFREDLLYRLNTITLNIPPLRDRKEDITELIEFFQKKFQKKYDKALTSISHQGMERLKNYSWPGNIRELAHCVERAVILSQNGEPKFSEFFFSNENKAQQQNSFETLNLNAVEEKIIRKALHDAKGNYTKAAEMLGIARKTLYNKIDKYGL